MSLEERLIAGNILDAYNAVGAQCDDLVHQLHRIAVRQQFADAFDIHHRLLIGVVERCLNLVFANLFAHLSRELIINGMAGTSGNDASLDGFADECHVSYDVEQLMAGTLVLPYQGLMLYVAEVSGIAVLHMQHVGQHVETLLSSLTFIDDDGIVQVSTLDEVGLQQRLNVTYKYESTCRGNLCGKIFHLVDCGKLRIDEFRFKRAHGCQREFIVRQNGNGGTCLLVLDLYLLANNIPILRCILFYNAYLVDFLNILDG